MALRRPPPIPPSPPAPKPISDAEAQRLAQEFLESLFGANGIPVLGGSVDYSCEAVLLLTTSVSGNVQTWRAPKDGFILGWISSAASQYGLSLRVDPPAAVGAAGSVYTGALWYPSSINPATAFQPFPAGLRIKFKATDAVNLKTYAATTVALWLFVAYFEVADPSTS